MLFEFSFKRLLHYIWYNYIWYRAEAGLELQTSASRGLGLQMCVTTPHSCSCWQYSQAPALLLPLPWSSHKVLRCRSTAWEAIGGFQECDVLRFVLLRGGKKQLSGKEYLLLYQRGEVPIPTSTRGSSRCLSVIPGIQYLRLILVNTWSVCTFMLV